MSLQSASVCRSPNKYIVNLSRLLLNIILHGRQRTGPRQPIGSPGYRYLINNSLAFKMAVKFSYGRAAYFKRTVYYYGVKLAQQSS